MYAACYRYVMKLKLLLITTTFCVLSQLMSSNCAADSQKLTVIGLNVNDEFFIFSVADRITEYSDIDGTKESVKRINALKEHWRFIEPIIYYYNQINNGGHHQYFWNSEGIYNQLVLDGLRYFKAREFEQIFTDCLRIYANSDKKIYRRGFFENFQRGYEERLYNEQDKTFYNSNYDLAEFIHTYVLSNIEIYK